METELLLAYGRSLSIAERLNRRTSGMGRFYLRMRDVGLTSVHSPGWSVVMENPSNWGNVRRLINHAIEKHNFETHQGILGERSLVSTIYEELCKAGYLVSEEDDAEKR